MIKFFFLFTSFVCNITLFTAFSADGQKCILKGKMIECNSQSIILLKAGEDLRFNGIEIPIKNQSFEYELNINQPEGYKLFLGEARQNNGGRFMCLFLEPGEINITIHNEDEFEKNIVTGSKLNLMYKTFKIHLDSINLKCKPCSDSLDILYDNGSCYSDSMKIVLAKLNVANSQDEKNNLYRKISDLQNAGLDFTEDAKKIREKINDNFQQQFDYQQEYIKNNPTIISYFLLYESLLYHKDKIDPLQARNNYEVLSNKFPSHTYNKAVKNLIESMEKIKIGGKFVDFSAPDLMGKTIKLSEIIDGKVAIIDLWATWCGPCIAKSRKMVSVYEEFKNFGFTVVGVAGEFKSTDNLKKFLAEEKFPWLNLVELDKQNRIWENYGIPNSGGRIFLVDKNGTVVLIDPTADEVKEKLKELLK